LTKQIDQKRGWLNMEKIRNMVNTNRINLSDAIPLPTPFTIHVEPSGFCNLRCVFCPVNDEHVQRYLKKDTMKLQTFIHVTDQCAQFPQAIKVLRFVGFGEPLLNKNLPEMIAYAKQSGVFNKIEIITNGTLLKPELSDKLIKAGLDILRISLEAIDDKRFYEISGISLNVEKIKENITYFYDNRKDCVVYIKTIDAAIRNEAEKQTFFTEYGTICDYIFIENITSTWPEYDVKIGQIEKDIYGCEISNEKAVCCQPFKALFVTADGEVLPCGSDWKRQLSLGNLHETPLLKIWKGNKLLQLQLSLLKGKYNSLCSSCDKHTRCDAADNIDCAKGEIINRLKSRKAV
jgi:radical SAM protein with 4Fe4S-binding SPASM domain